jgi:sugar phosphate isomerase/epimerase
MTLNSKYKFGFNVFNKPPEDFFYYASETGLKHIEINLTKEHSCLISFNPERIENLHKIAKEHQVELSLHLPYALNIADNISLIGNSNIVYMEKCVEFASLIKATHITAHIGNYYWFPVNSWKKRNALNRFIKRMETIITACEKLNITFALENVVPIPHGTEFYLLGDSIEDFNYIYEKLDSDNLKFCLDAGHANMAEGVLQYTKELKDKLICIHYHDNKKSNDEHLVVGEGTIAWTEFAQELKNIDFSGPLISECRGVKPHQAAQKLQSYFDKLK